MRFRTPDGHEYRARTYNGIVIAMSADKLTQPCSLETYMKETAKRIRQMFHLNIDSSTSRKFVCDLVSHKLLERVQ